MTARIVITGTDTGVGKTVFAAALADALGAAYWKPVQAGLDGETDSQVVARLGQLAPDRIHPEAWRLRAPASPHLAAELDMVTLSPETLTPPETSKPLIIEGAGGVLVPLTRRATFADVLARWRFPVILCARTSLGTINHTLLSLEALRRRDIPVLGVAFIGAAQTDSEQIIATMSGAARLGRLPMLAPLTSDTLRGAFAADFDATHILQRAAA